MNKHTGEPVAWIEHHKGGDNLNWEEVNHPYAKATPLYTTPQPAPQRSEDTTQKKSWVGLTGEEVRQMCGSVPSMKEVVLETEAKLKAKNERVEKNK